MRRYRAGSMVTGESLYGARSLALWAASDAPAVSPPSHRVQSTVRRRMPPEPHRTHVRNTVVMIVLAILAAATWIATWQRQAAARPATASADARAARVTTCAGRGCSGTDEQGRVTYRIFAERLERCPAKSDCELDGRQRRLRSPRTIPLVHVGRERADAPKDGSQLDLVGNVEVRSSPVGRLESRDNRHGAAAVFARHLERRVGRKSWRSVSATGNSRAVGLRTDLKEDTLELESQVHGTLRSS